MGGREPSIEAYHRGLEASRSGDREAALVHYAEAIRLNPQNDLALKNRAGLYLKMEAWDDAITDCTTLLQINRSDTFAYNTRGNAYLGKGDYHKAIEDQTKALVFEQEGIWESSYFWRGLAYLKAKEFFKAIADFDRADSPHELLNDVLQSRAIAYDAIGEHEAAARDRERVEAKPIPHRPELDDLVRGLVNGWCERQVLGPLKWLLPAWPLSTGMADEWRKLRNALRAAQSIERKQITNEEVERLLQAQRIVTEALSGN